MNLYADELLSEPKTFEEMIVTAHVGAAFRMVHEARLHGVIKGGPPINAIRCEELMMEAELMGIPIDIDAVVEVAAQIALTYGIESVPSILCPSCNKISHNPNDIEQKYCGNCHKFHKDLAIGSKLYRNDQAS